MSERSRIILRCADGLPSKVVAAELGIHEHTVGKWLLRFLKDDPLFVDKVRDIVGLYLSPPNRALVLSVDEKSQIQTFDREQPVLPMMPGVPERRTHCYVHHGTTLLFAALDVASGFVIGKCYKRHRAAEFLDFIKQLDAQVPQGSRCPHHHGQLRDPQNGGDQGMAGAAAALSCAFHANIGILDQSGRRLVC